MNNDVRSLDDMGLTATLRELAAHERETTVALIVHLAEFDARQLYRGLGFPSLFQFCVEVLRLSEDAASNRIAAARMARRFPDVIDRLVAGSLSPTTVRMIAKHAMPETLEKGRALIDAATGKTKREVEHLLARLYPEADVAARVRPLGPPGPFAPPAPLPCTRAADESGRGTAVPAACPRAGSPGPEGPSVTAPGVGPTPVATAATPAPDRYEVRFTAKADTIAKLQMVQDLLSHAVPSGDVAEVVDRALTVLAEQLLRKKFALTRSPRTRAGSGSSANPPAAARRAVWLEDRGR